MQTQIRPCRGDFLLKINKRACTSIRHTRVPFVDIALVREFLYCYEGKSSATYLPHLVNVIKERPLIQLGINILRITFLTTIEVHTSMSESRLKYLERNYTIYVVKGGLLSEVNFNLVQSSKKMNEITFLNS